MMKTYSKRLISNLISCLVLLILIIFFGSCQRDSIQEDPLKSINVKTSLNGANKIEGVESNEKFPVYHQGFEKNLDAWVDGSGEGQAGWCGMLELRDRWTGEVSPSVGNGYAIAMHGTCNDFWTNLGYTDSAPSVQDPALWSSSWPVSGFVQQLDIYLDPAQFEDGLAFSYANSIKILEEMEFRYFAIEVTKEGDELYVDGFPVSEEGWYTFRHVFGSDEGRITVDFELIEHGHPIYTAPIERSLFSGDLTEDLETSDFGTGYLWFPAIAEGVGLAIDEYRLRPGK